jgi:hypothetical protein
MTSTKSIIDLSNSSSSAEEFYKENGKELKILMALSMGLKNMFSNRFIFDEANDVLKGLNVPESEYTPNEEVIYTEVARRTAKDLTLPHIYSWDMDCCQSFLSRYPISDPIDVAFIEKTVYDDAAKGLIWNDEVPFLRLIHVLAVPHIKPLFHNRFDFPKSLRYRKTVSRAAMDFFASCDRFME